MSRSFNDFLKFCKSSLAQDGFDNLSLTGAFNRIIHYTNNNHTGHFMQLFYATYDFLTLNPRLRSQITAPPFQIGDNIAFLNAWEAFLMNPSNDCSEYSVCLIREKLPTSCGGNLVGGGGWSPTLKVIFPCVERYI